jgi:catechol 2,3-dioxygenase-like lactoylglutathione lyase family enzyme
MSVLGINHIAFRTPAVERLKGFYRDLFAAEPLSGEHDPLRVGLLLVFFPAATRQPDDRGVYWQE